MIRQPEEIEIEVDDLSDVPLLLWIVHAYTEGEADQGPIILAAIGFSLVIGLLIGVKL